MKKKPTTAPFSYIISPICTLLKLTIRHTAITETAYNIYFQLMVPFFVIGSLNTLNSLLLLLYNISYLLISRNYGKTEYKCTRYIIYRQYSCQYPIGKYCSIVYGFDYAGFLLSMPKSKYDVTIWTHVGNIHVYAKPTYKGNSCVLLIVLLILVFS
jgi:hypothetical protein